MIALSDRSRQWLEVALTSASIECIEWPWGRDYDGYGIVHQAGRTRRLSHVVLEALGHPRPRHAIALHSCDNPPCGNPAHLRWGTHAENLADAQARGRYRNGRLRIPSQTVAAVHERRAGGETQVAIARALGISQPHVSSILRGVSRDE
jgi:hypothetical protein